ncbi:hypothetical protein [Streptacidiphilus sp. EB103A]|uniref:hypothetical protein n=1 Tax=Streptacidiphilus sp. EB103A TaxID=3156275 RepID=UPI00351973D2
MRHLTKRLAAVASTSALAAGLALLSGGQAHAANQNWYSTASTGDACGAFLDVYNPHQDYVQATFAGWPPGSAGKAYAWTSCVGSVYRSSNYGKSWTRISPYGTINEASHWDEVRFPSYNTMYWDGPGLRVKACVSEYEWGIFVGQACTKPY